MDGWLRDASVCITAKEQIKQFRISSQKGWLTEDFTRSFVDLIEHSFIF